MSDYNLGRFIIKPQGQWNPDRSDDYSFLDLVYTSDGSSFVAKMTTPKEIDPNSLDGKNYWQLVAIKGSDGSQGIQGEKGDKGDKGDQGEQGEKGDKGDQGEYAEWVECTREQYLEWESQGLIEEGVCYIIDGNTGVDCTHEWQGTTLIVTSASGTSSADLKGEKGNKGDKGEKGDQGEQGEKGDKGDDGQDGQDGQDGKDAEWVTLTQEQYEEMEEQGTLVEGVCYVVEGIVQGPKGDKGDKGDQGEQGVPGQDGVTTIIHESDEYLHWFGTQDEYDALTEHDENTIYHIQGGSSGTVDWNDIINKPTIPSVGNGEIVIKQGGEEKGRFTLNQTNDVEINLEQGGSGGSSDWNDITNKPNWLQYFYDSNNALGCNREIVFNISGMPSTEDITNGWFSAFKTAVGQINKLATEKIIVGDNKDNISFYKKTGSGVNDIEYIGKIDSDGNFYEGDTKLSDKYASKNYETWTFELEDGTTITKNIAIE